MVAIKRKLKLDFKGANQRCRGNRWKDKSWKIQKKIEVSLSQKRIFSRIHRWFILQKAIFLDSPMNFLGKIRIRSSPVQAPQPPSPHPSFVPVQPEERRYCRSVVSGSGWVTSWRVPLMKKTRDIGEEEEEEGRGGGECVGSFFFSFCFFPFFFFFFFFSFFFFFFSYYFIWILILFEF